MILWAISLFASFFARCDKHCMLRLPAKPTMNSEAQQLCKSIMKGCNIDIQVSDCDDGDSETIMNASCSPVSETKTIAVQTNTRYRKVRNKTTTTDLQLVQKLIPKIEAKINNPNSPTRQTCDIHAIITFNVVARNPNDNAKTASARSSDRVFRLSLTDENNKNERLQNKCTCTSEDSVEESGCVESCTYSCRYGGVGPCKSFSLGTANYRMLMRQKCNSMLIGGCRVPVCRNFKNRFD